MKKKSLLLTAVALMCISSAILAQAPSIQWQKCIGGTNDEDGYLILPSEDGGYIIAGKTSSNDFDATGNPVFGISFPFDDVLWVVKLDSLGVKKWHKFLNGYSSPLASNTNGPLGGIFTTKDGGCIVFSHSGSAAGDANCNLGVNDIWMVKLGISGTIEWQKCIGGSDYDTGLSAIITSDNGYIISGTTFSNDGDVSGNHGGEDIWLVKLDSLGTIEWQQCYGGSSGESTILHSSIQQTNDEGFVFLSQSGSNDGDVVGLHDYDDIWINKIDFMGNITWQSFLGGSGQESKGRILQTSDKGYIVSCQTFSNDGDVSGNHGGGDIWLVKLDSLGTIDWQRCYGGSGLDIPFWTDNDDLGYILIQNLEGSYFLSTTTSSNDGDVSGNHGQDDIWVVKLDSIGEILWQKCIGGTSWEILTGAILLNSGIVIYGLTSSFDGDFSSNHGMTDGFIAQIDDSGNVQWSNCYGGSNSESFTSSFLTTTDGFAILGTTNSNDGDLIGNHGGRDLWVSKFLYSPTNISETLKSTIVSIYPNPTNDHITIDNGDYTSLNGYQIIVSNTLGQQVFQSAITQQSFYVNITTWGGAGVYFVNIINPNGVTTDTRKIVLQ